MCLLHRTLRTSCRLRKEARVDIADLKARSRQSDDNVLFFQILDHFLVVVDADQKKDDAHNKDGHGGDDRTNSIHDIRYPFS